MTEQDRTGTRIRKRRAAKYVRGGFLECYICLDSPDEIHHTSYFPEEAVAVCKTCHAGIHSDEDNGLSHLQPDTSRPEDYETRRRRQEKVERYNSRSWQMNMRLKLAANSTAAATSGYFTDLPHPEVEE